jgi:hypothetical protein
VRQELDRLQSSRFEAGLDLILLCDDELAGEGEVREDAEYVFPVHSTDFPGQALASPDKHFPTAKEVATEAARQAVFQTNELVQNILVHLPAMTIFEMQRVSKSFQSAIDNSALIQKKPLPTQARGSRDQGNGVWRSAHRSTAESALCARSKSWRSNCAEHAAGALRN